MKQQFTKKRTDKHKPRCYTVLKFPKRRSWSCLAPVIPQQRGRKTRKRGLFVGATDVTRVRSIETETKWAGLDPKSSVDLGICPGQCDVLDAELSGGIYYVQKLFRSVFPSQGNATIYIRSTGVRPSRRMPLAMTCRAASYRAIRAFCNSGSLPTILRWSYEELST